MSEEIQNGVATKQSIFDKLADDLAGKDYNAPRAGVVFYSRLSQLNQLLCTLSQAERVFKLTPAQHDKVSALLDDVLASI